VGVDDDRHHMSKTSVVSTAPFDENGQQESQAIKSAERLKLSKPQSPQAR